MFVSSFTTLLSAKLHRTVKQPHLYFTQPPLHYTTHYTTHSWNGRGRGIISIIAFLGFLTLNFLSVSVTVVSSWMFCAAGSDSCASRMRRNPSSRVRDLLSKALSTLASNLLISMLFAAISRGILRNSRSCQKKWPPSPGFSGLTETRGSGRAG